MKNDIIAVVGCGADKKIKDALSDLGFEVHEIKNHTSLPLPVRSHPDMQIFALEGQIFCDKTTYSDNKELFGKLSSIGYSTVICDVTLGDTYPNDVAFNIAVIGKSILGRLKSCAAEILESADRSGYQKISVKQGYAKCSTLILDSNSAITADKTIAKALESMGTNVLKISNSPSAVSLKGYDYGFIGGASGVFKNTVYFTGSLDGHPCGREIRDFCISHGKEIVELSLSLLEDIGGILFFPPILM